MSRNLKVKSQDQILTKLYHRQIFGKFPLTFKGTSSVPFFNRPIERLVFQLDKVIPLSALEAGHVLLGFSKCGQFLLTYTHSIELEGNLITVVHRYKLHWWSFIPYRKASKVSEVTLFSDQGVQLPLQIYLCYWPNDTSHIVIHGCSTLSDGESRECYLTITSVPSLNGCRECNRIAQSYGDEDLAASWDSCVRFSCLRHGWTLHSAYTIVPPFPSFNGAVSLRCDGVVVINTANFLHVLSAHLEFPKPDETASSEDLLFPIHGASMDEVQQIHQDWEEESLDDRPCSNIRYTPTRATPPSTSRTAVTPTRSPAFSTTTTISSYCISQNTCRKRMVCSPSLSRGIADDNGGVSSTAESEYDFMEDASELPRETISAFRKRRLADKKYEFRDENTENVPLKILRKRRGPGSGGDDGLPSLNNVSVVVSSDRPNNKESNEDWEWNFSSHTNDVLRPFNFNIPSSIRSPEWDHEETRGSVQSNRDPVTSFQLPALLPPPTKSVTQTPTCVVKFNRRYFEVDDELVSVITDIEDDDLSSSTGYHSALPLEVHGAGYAQMQMVSNVKALKLNMPHVSVRQMSIDTEQLCHEMAQRLCALSNKKYWFCTDFNVEIIDMCLETDDVVAIAFMLVEADVVEDNQIKRRLCQASAHFTWNIETGQHRIIDFDLPVDVTSGHCIHSCSNRGKWHPARDVGARLRKELLTPTQPIWTLSNKPELTGQSLSVIYDPTRTFAIVL